MRRVPRRTLGAEEEFHLVDLKTRRLTARAPELLAELTEDYVAELQRCVVETNTQVVDSLGGLREQLVRQRKVLVEAATELGMGVVAAGAVPLAVPAEMRVTKTPRYRQMLADYQLLAREQLICGTQVHVGVADRDEAVEIAHRVAAYLPTLLALSASSPFASDGSDTGYASMRTLVWQRWPTTGPAAPVHSAAEYDQLVADLVASGVISDVGMVYFDVRPANSVPTLELRVCDSCPSVDTVVLIAGMFRALVDREADAVHAGTPATVLSPALARAALWRAARSGLEGQLVDVRGPASRPASDVVGELVDALRAQLEQSGDWETVSELSRQALVVGSSSARQRRALRRRGRLTDVVDQLIVETAARGPTLMIVSDDPTLLYGYQPGNKPAVIVPDERLDDGYDEAVDAQGRPRQHYRAILEAIAGLGAAALRSRESDIEQEQRADNVTFRVTGQSRAQLLPLDLVPRMVAADEWARLSDGLAQRARALDAFLRDIYSKQAIVGDGIIGPQVLDRAPGFRSTGRPAGNTVRAHVSGTDIVCDRAGNWMVLEDNLRVPSGVAYAVVSHRLLRKHLPELQPPAAIEDAGQAPAMLLETLRAAAPAHASDNPAVVILSAGWTDSAWFEHTFLAEEMGTSLVQPSDLAVRDGKLVQHIGSSIRPIDVVYARMDEDMLLSSTGHDGAPLRPGLLGAITDGNLTIANALANGVADDKAIYAYVPAMIEYYLGEKPKLAQVPTWICAEREQRDYVLANLGDLVVKPIDGLGGSGVLIGPEASESALEVRRRELEIQPERFIAQETINLSTHPTFDGDGLYPHHVDLRAFVHLRAGGNGSVSTHVMPVALTRVASRGSRIVNSSSGGGSKDTWILSGPRNGSR
ncbi:carboxylate--amine ligase/circularly permuted type 2 ATP-grasp protein [Mycobacterium sp. Aquia_216]|uniref:carboxylate--amine ligase/circularly permuted type 2 ATP-grasp protein n=1 Tax=Mycobacterium sp. Aquia_216 TaxID=2991729 RepID=UPI00227CEFD9|nr:carboxylate--amine ligase/circularly permuted type 2 ATP-grasp protein [Mycobacterium sp. Aquia_216]WAJ46216.1 carboxylate--amine ligase/circularly permuted type 2 ATP-grasp protein [Mycobacterium sp. Aquia_216]